ncbi:hypothetical protein NX905_29225, partial [Burkholderia thailandensis]|uniref:hypothetical protein n=1 Tax=Burkholderia thailandensis TaxID=57975 RepID=UPI00217E3219
MERRGAGGSGVRGVGAREDGRAVAGGGAARARARAHWVALDASVGGECAAEVDTRVGAAGAHVIEREGRGRGALA